MSLRLEGLSFAYGGRPPVIEHVSVCLQRGDRVAFLGANGSGKSTLARCLAGWLKGKGQVLWDGRAWASYPADERARLVQLVDQNPRLQLSGRAFTVRDEIAFGPENLCLGREEIGMRVDEALAVLNLELLAHRDPTTLSGGELQRVILAGALAMRPQMLVLDEPSTDLDANSCQLLATYLAALPLETTVVVFDTEPHRWLAPLISRTFILDRKTVAENAARTHAQIYRSARLALPDALNAFLDGQEARLFDQNARLPTTLEAVADLFRGKLE